MASSDVKEYSPDLIRVILFLIPISGFGEDDIIEYTPDEDGFTEVKGVDGDITTVKTVASAGTLNLTLGQASRANAALWSAYNADRLANGGAGIGPILIQDGNGTGAIASDTARIVRHPDVKFGKLPQGRVWKIRVYNPIVSEGGY